MSTRSMTLGTLSVDLRSEDRAVVRRYHRAMLKSGIGRTAAIYKTCALAELLATAEEILRS